VGLSTRKCKLHQLVRTQKKIKTAPYKSTWFFSSLDMPDAALPEALEAGSLQKVSTSNISTPSNKEIRTH
jgi:hypothetical protein